MVTKRTVDRVGGVASVVVGLVCALMGLRDWQMEHSLWKVWAVMCVVLVLNGVAMIRYSVRKRAERGGDASGPRSIVGGSTRV